MTFRADLLLLGEKMLPDQEEFANMAGETNYERPRALKKGDVIGLIAPSSPFAPEPFYAALAFLQDQGFQVRYRPDILTRGKGFLAGEDHERLEELHDTFQDPDIQAIFVVRGGYGAGRLLENLDPDIICRNPKIFCGYSDATCLLSFFLDRCHMICFHGPVFNEMGDLSALSRRSLFQCLMEPVPLGRLPLETAQCLHTGRARAPLIGGNLSMLCSSLGTPWEVQTAGRILFLEDWGEQPYKVDRMLVQLRQAGKLSEIAGLLFGQIQVDKNATLENRDKIQIDKVLRENTSDLGVPVVSGLPVGHGRDNITLPLGVMSELDTDKNSFSILEPAVLEGIL